MPVLRAAGVVQRLLDLPIRTKLYGLVGLLVFDLVVVASLGAFGMGTLSSLRAYVGGEGLWAKAQKSAVNSLGRYALSRDEKDFQAFERYLGIPLGDRRARLELEKPRPDYRVSDAAFIEGGNHPDDVRGMAHLFRRFQRVGYIERAIGLWREADAELAELQAAAAGLKRDVAAGAPGPKVRERLDRIDAIDARLTRIENAFSYTLGEASRWAKRVLFLAMAGGALLFGGLGLAAALLIGRGVVEGVGALSSAAARVEGGDFKLRVEVGTRDELGLLAGAFNRMSAGLAELERAKSEFLATASHELRTPLSLVLAPLESLLAGDLGALDARQRETLRMMHNNAIRQLQLVTGLLDFSRAEAGKLELKREPLDAAALTRSIVDGFRPLARGKALSLELSAALEAPVVLLDRYLYERIVFNLLSNAVKFTPRDGSVRVVLAQGEGRLRLSVRDTGIGISPADRPALFRKFRQLESSSTRRFEGTGLGLALVREFALLLGGEVSVKAAPVRGSEFVVDLAAPLCAAPAAALPAPAGPSLTPRYAPAQDPPPLASTGEGGVLIAEDNAELASYLRGLLQDLGPVRVARDGEEALRLARTRRPELVVADVMMPRLDGLGLCRALKANPLTAAIPVILLTALTDRDSLARGWKAGADEYLFKPFHPKEVLTRARSLLAAGRARRRAEEMLAAKNAELEAANRDVVKANEELKSFNYSVTHDLRAPLHSLDAFCVLLERALPADAGDDARAFIKHIHSGVARMDAIIIGMLQLSRVMSREFAAGETDLSAAAASIAAELARGHPGRAVELSVEPGVSARADETMVRIVLQNLLENAWKFTSGRSPARIEFGLVLLDGEEAYFVRDDGAGFDMAYAQGLFTPFHRLHSAKDFPGTGIGLATVRRVAERHGGRVWAEAAPGKGATFYFTLAPRAGAAGLPAAGGSSPARGTAGSAG